MKVEDMPPDPRHPGKHINPETGIWPTCEWGYECQRGLISDQRSGQGIKRRNGNATRRWRPSAQENQRDDDADSLAGPEPESSTRD
jgi:hypothetical protein